MLACLVRGLEGFAYQRNSYAGQGFDADRSVEEVSESICHPRSGIKYSKSASSLSRDCSISVKSRLAWVSTICVSDLGASELFSNSVSDQKHQSKRHSVHVFEIVAASLETVTYLGSQWRDG